MPDHFTFAHPEMHPDVIHVLGPYKPWGWHKQNGGNGNDYPRHSGSVLDIKESRERGLRYFQSMLEEMIKVSKFAMVVVPSHDALKLRSGLHILTTRLQVKTGLVDGGSYLVRTKTIAKLATGGDRSIQVHVDSVSVAAGNPVYGHKIMLIDDVVTTGNSMVACRRILLAAGAASVDCVALSKTTY